MRRWTWTLIVVAAGCGAEVPSGAWYDPAPTTPPVLPTMQGVWGGEMALDGMDGYLAFVAGDDESPACDMTFELVARAGEGCLECDHQWRLTVGAPEIEAGDEGCEAALAAEGRTFSLGVVGEGLLQVDFGDGWMDGGWSEVSEDEGQRSLEFELELAVPWEPEPL